MEPEEAPWRKVEMRSGMELAVLSETGQYRIGPSASFPKIRGIASSLYQNGAHVA
jgi:hypothetical protein